MSAVSEEGLALGKRLREFRRLRKVTVRQLGAHAGVSPAFISQIENGRANASIEILRKLSGALGVSFGDLFTTTTTTGLVLRRADRPTLWTEQGVRNYQITRPPLAEVEVTVTEYEPGAGSGGDDYTHGDSHEVVVILRGRFEFRLGGQDFVLDEGDSLEYRTSTPHQITNIGDVPGEALWVVSPPSLG
ncbi:helix-turn-helix domain-containing protein [Saccharopolyspora sp. ASAGF58]|uniref:helix-turn-helix domain-containing protein n=1 Tax=Saccharopolyspora sp. ASAGF58 TaxID=2719023 RepID=UPI0014402821|nr:XRE family transcriptional regulator [Saccharopolyspora sp. ASAGF58]QIZ37244.1 cupin domain-containing protein [Saccharopolyspora sp. ASAGF58]